MGRRVGIDREMISDWMIVDGGRLIGGYTIRAIRNQLPEEQLADFDRGLGGIYVDEGVDHLPVDDTTPEGALLLLEQAYQEDNLEKALSLKAFEEEAKTMLPPQLAAVANESTIKTTAEAVKQSFLQHMSEHGMPKFDHIVSYAFPIRKAISPEHVVVIKVSTTADGEKQVDRMHTYLVEGGWKVGAPYSS